MMVTEKTSAREVARRVYDYQMDRYLTGRGETVARGAAARGRGPAVHRLPQGRGRACTRCASTSARSASTPRCAASSRSTATAGPPYPTSLDLYAELRAVTPDSLQYLLTDLFETITLWDVKTERAAVEPTGTGEYRVTLDVVAKKLRADSVGNETEVPMNDLVEIGVFAPGEGDGLGEPLYLKRHRIRSGKQTIRIIVPREPARAGIDPYRKLIERERDDNVVGVETAGTDPAGTGR